MDSTITKFCYWLAFKFPKIFNKFSHNIIDNLQGKFTLDGTLPIKDGHQMEAKNFSNFL